MKKWELIAKAYQDYPKGTEFISLADSATARISTGVFVIDDNGLTIQDPNSTYYVYNRGKWAEIVENGSDRRR